MVTLNCDMGEAFGLYHMGDDEALMPLISIANVACGFHASDYNHMNTTVALAKRHGVRVGAHPSLPDLQGFGRREMAMTRHELANCLIYQIGALKGFLDAHGMTLNHIKPHGSLYGMASRLEHVAHAVCDAADVFRVPLLGMAGTLHETIYRQRGHEFIAEFYADLDYSDEGALVITRVHDARDPAGCGGALPARHHRRQDAQPRRQGHRRAMPIHLRPFRHAERGRGGDRRPRGGGVASRSGLTFQETLHGDPVHPLTLARHVLPPPVAGPAGLQERTATRSRSAT